MSKRNFILLIIILAVAIIAFFGFLYFRQPVNPTGNDAGGTNFFSQFNPFSRPAAEVDKPEAIPEETGSTDINIGTGTMKLKKISSMPIAGFTVFSKERLKDVPVPVPTLPVVEPVPTGTLPSKAKIGSGTPTPPLTEFMPALRYVDRATGNIYQTFADKIEERKFSTTVILMVYEAFFGNNGESVIMRYLKADAKTIITFVGTLPKEFLGADTTDSNEIKGTFLPENTKDVSLSGDAKSLFYLFSSGNNGDSVVGTILNFLNNKKIQVFDSPFTEWLSQFPNSKMITFTTKPASGILGYMYALDPGNKNYNFHQVLGNINGLTTLTSPNGKLILYSNDGLALKVYHTDTKVSDVLGVKTLAEKCVWSSTNNVIYCGVPKLIDVGLYPDAWYQGGVSFSDQIWKIDIKTGNATIIADPAAIPGGPTSLAGGEEIDSIKLMLDDGENYLFFVNKKDSFLWELGLK